ncbi:DUF2158 domain-containing protein [Bradyrhizobium ottawaense]|uniref:Uncharacterized protein YodC (DUF2158 family) n=1 Tax=Bradyrhizobium ottawaense TaxID=931866 RepID=A0ABV4G2E5_9BRAD
MADGIKAGDIVQLKSGGPMMTVDQVGEIYGDPKVWCEWFVQDKAPWKKEQGVFSPTSLKIIGSE